LWCFVYQLSSYLLLFSRTSADLSADVEIENLSESLNHFGVCEIHLLLEQSDMRQKGGMKFLCRPMV
jgi:hypothetical protein